MPVHHPTRRARRYRARGATSMRLILIAMILVLLVGLALAKRPSDADTIELPTEVLGA